MSETDFGPQLTGLRAAGAGRLEPLQLHYLEALAERAQARQGSVRRILDGKLARALAALTQRLEQAQRPAESAVATRPRAQARDSLALLAHELAHHRPAPTAPESSAAARPEPKSAQYFRDTWSKISAAKQVTQALQQAPRNAGPINSQRVLLASLALMRDISPDYLNRFMCYADTLLCLDQRSSEAKASAKASADSSKAKKVGSLRVRTR